MAIETMKHVSIVVLDSEKRGAVKTLRRAGVVHLEELTGKGEQLAYFREESSGCDRALSVLDGIKVAKGASVDQKTLGRDAAREKVREILSLSDNQKRLLESINANNAELARFSRWGEVSREDFSTLAEKGVFLYMYEIPEALYARIGEDCKTIRVNTSDRVTRFLLVSDKALEGKPRGLPSEATAVPLPLKSTKTLLGENRDAEVDLSGIDEKLYSEKCYGDTLRSYRAHLASDIEFETVVSGMHTEEDASPPGRADGAAGAKYALAWLSGFVPESSVGVFTDACKKESWAYIVRDVTDEDNVPTKLNNNRVVSLIYPLTNFLDVTPGYNEYDISGWFLLFFCIFFAMIFGDGGYGLLICALGLIMMLRGRKSGKAAAPVNILVLLLGLCTVVWGTLTCTWFGIAAERLPAWLRGLSLAPISAAKVGDAANDNQKILCFILAVVQLSIAHLKGVWRDRRTLKVLGDAGSLMMIWGMFFVVLNLVVDSVRFPIPLAAIAVLGVGFVLNFVFANYEGSIGESVLASLKSIISVLLGVVNNFSDIVSYIRLWAVALAGSAISSTVNEMASPMLGRLILIIFGVVLLCFGHGLNIILNLLSVIVHGVRLNTLEFSQHLGMSWSGTRYAPFREHI